jgi:hypothetical protein
VWNKTYGGSGGEWALSVRLTADGGYVVAGSTNSSGAGNCDICLVKFAPALYTPPQFSSLSGATLSPMALAQSGDVHLVVRGADNGIYYKVMDLGTGSWGG